MDQKTKQLLAEFKAFHEGLASATPVDTTETGAQKRARIKELEANPEEWFIYYFPSYAKSQPADFHKAATRRVLGNPEWYEVRSWSRELAKSTRTMLEVLYLTLTKKKRNVLLISNSKENADRLLLPYMVNLEKNQRIINDYGIQVNIGTWTTGEFITKHGAAFRALGAGQSPRGTRNEAIRPDVILIDDLDTDEDCRNPDIIEKRWNWIQEALIPTRSISNPLLLIFCGNIIAEDCCIVRASKIADKFDVVNIRDENGKSSWPQKNSEADIDRVLKTISYAAQQKEYFNNPMSTGNSFPEIKFATPPPIHTLPFVVVYADPAPGNKDKPGAKSTEGNSRKAICITGRKGNEYYVYKVFLDVMGTARFIASLYACRDYITNQCLGHTIPPIFVLIENNSLQDPFFEQVYRPQILAYGKDHGGALGIMPDTRKKPDKWFRIEATLQPLNSVGLLVFNAAEQEDEHMKRMQAQFKAARPNARELDGPDCIEGAVYIINQKSAAISTGSIRTAPRTRNENKSY